MRSISSETSIRNREAGSIASFIFKGSNEGMISGSLKQAAVMAVSTNALTGKALLNKLKDLSHLSKSEKAKACGYVMKTKGGVERTNLSAFIEAILEAQGLSVDPEQADGRGRAPTYRVTVHANGQIVIGKAYTEMMGLQPGDEFEIKLGYKHIHLVKLESSPR